MNHKKSSEYITDLIESHKEASSTLKVAFGSTAGKSKETGVLEHFYGFEEIFSNVIHGCKNLLGPIKGYASLIQDDNDESSNTKRWADKIVQNVVRMEDYYEMLNMYRITGAATVRETTWQQIVSAVLDRLAIINVKGVSIEITNDVSGTFVQRSEMLKRVMCHLMINAYESIDATGKLSLNINEDSGDNKGNRKFIVQVMDTGCGIPGKNRDLIWKPFFTTKHDHIGLGLSYVAAAAPILDMHTEVRTNDSGGTTVELVLSEQGGKIETETSGR